MSRTCGKGTSDLHRGIPGLALQCGFQLGAFQVLVVPLLKPTGGGNDIQRIGRRHEELGQQHVRIKRNRCQQRVELFDVETFRGGRGRAGRHGVDGGRWDRCPGLRVRRCWGDAHY